MKPLSVWFSYLAALLGSLGSAFAESNGATAVTRPPDIFFEVMEKFGGWRNSIDSMDVTFSWQSEPWFAENPVELRQGKTMNRQSRFLWSDWWSHRDSQLRKTITRRLDQTILSKIVITGFDGNYQYLADFPEPAAVPTLMTVTEDGSKKTLSLSAERALFPIYFALTGWFQGAFEQSSPHYLGTRVIHGQLCIGIKVNCSGTILLWLDLNHDGLPRLIEFGPTDSFRSWECREFNRTTSGHWFPRSGGFNTESEFSSEFRVDSVELNIPIPLEEFRLPEIGQGTYVRDHTRQGVDFKKMQSTPSQAEDVGSPVSWWRIHCSFGMLLSSAGWLQWRRFCGKGNVTGSRLRLMPGNGQTSAASRWALAAISHVPGKT